MLANVLAVGGALGLAPRVLTGFVDVEVDRLLGLDTAREVSLELVALGPEVTSAQSGGALDAIDHATLPLSSSEVDYPLIHEIHAASRLDTAGAVTAWRARAWSPTPAPPAAGAELVELPPPRARAGRGLDETIQRRGSTREFGHAPLTARGARDRALGGDAAPRCRRAGGLVELYLVVNAVDGRAGRRVLLPGAGAPARDTADRRASEPVGVSLPRAGARRGRGGRDLLAGAARRAHARLRRSRRIVWRISRRAWPAAAPTLPRTPRDSAPPVSRSTTATWSSSSRRTPLARTRSS